MKYHRGRRFISPTLSLLAAASLLLIGVAAGNARGDETVPPQRSLPLSKADQTRQYRTNLLGVAQR
jgi:hypothetical protein